MIEGILMKKQNIDRPYEKFMAFGPAYLTDAELLAIIIRTGTKGEDALELAKRKIPYELHVYPECEHGASTCNYEINGEYAPLRRAARWVDDCCYFFRLFTTEKF